MPRQSKLGFAKAPKPPASDIAKADHQLRDKIQEFAFQARFRAEADRALVRFFGKAVARTRQIVADEGELPEFQEWYFFDFQTRSGESIDERMARQPTRPSSGSARPDPALQALDRKVFEEQMEHWLDEPVAGFGGQTPREAVRTPAGRAKVIDALKVFEYTQAQRLEAGETWYDVDRLRRELGLPVP